MHTHQHASTAVQYSPNEEEITQQKTEMASTIKELLCQEAKKLGITAPEDDDRWDSVDDYLVSKLLEQEVVTLPPDEEECARYYRQNAAAFTDANGGKVPFSMVKDSISAYLRQCTNQIAVQHYIRNLVNKAALAPSIVQAPDKKKFMINRLQNHKPKKVFDSKEAVVFDDFLPEDIYQRMYDFAIKSDYKRINTHGTVSRAWLIEDGFPFRSSYDYFYHARNAPQPQGTHIYPTRTDADIFIAHLLSIQPQVEHIVGKEGEREGWEHFSFTAWLYPMGTALSMHDDGAGVYHGAYAYYLNPVWRPHWGGLNIMIGEEGNRPVYAHAEKMGGMEFYKRKWFHANQLDEILVNHGLGYCIFPKRNRIAFIADNAYHMVTRVNEAAGDNHRMTLTGFFNRPKSRGQSAAQRETLGGYE